MSVAGTYRMRNDTDSIFSSVRDNMIDVATWIELDIEVSMVMFSVLLTMLDSIPGLAQPLRMVTGLPRSYFWT